MASSETIGEIREEHEIEWRIEEFLEKDAECYSSPKFNFADNSWHLNMHQNGDGSKNEGYISLYLCKNSFGPPIRTEYSMGLKTVDGKEDRKQHCSHVFEKANVGYGWPQFMLRSDISKREDEYVPSKVLTVFCNLKKQQFTKGTTNEKLLNDLKEMMLSKDHSDITVQVKDVEFQLHRNILEARSPYFQSMFECEMIEKATGVVSIDDCEPDTFRSFIYFLYTGKTNDLSFKNVRDIYELADKYQEDQLKTECLYYMMNEITTDSFCVFIVMSLKYDEKKLLQTATEFFCKKAKEIIRNVKWHTFLKEYPIQANELYMKALDYSEK